MPLPWLVEKSDWHEQDHPRDDHGRFVSDDEIDAARADPTKVAALRARVTDPEQRKKLDGHLRGAAPNGRPPAANNQVSPGPAIRKAVAAARAKVRACPVPTKEAVAAAHDRMDAVGADRYEADIRGNTSDRAASRKRLLAEFGDGTTCPCVYCGIPLVDEDGPNLVTRDKIKTARQGGRYNHANLLPACLACNKRRSDTPIEKVKWAKGGSDASDGDDVPRRGPGDSGQADRGRVGKTPGADAGVHTAPRGRGAGRSRDGAGSRRKSHHDAPLLVEKAGTFDPAGPDTRKGIIGDATPWLVSKAPHDVSAQARDQIGRFAQGHHQRTVSGVTWERSPAAADAGEVLIEVDTLALDAAWRKDKGYYLAFGGEDKTKYQQAKDFILSGERAVHAPRVHLDVKTGALSFIDGRNRAAVCRDMDLRKLCVTVSKEDAERTRAALGGKAKSAHGVTPWLVVKAGHDVSGEPRDARVVKAAFGQWDESAHARESTSHDGKRPGEFAPGTTGGMSNSDAAEPFEKVLYRAADDDIITDSASFSTSRMAAEAYLDNPGFGGRHLWKTTVRIDPEKFLDLHDLGHDEAVAKVRELTGLKDPGGIGVDEWVPRIADKLRDAGIEWVRVLESHPTETETFIFLGGDDPEMKRLKR